MGRVSGGKCAGRPFAGARVWRTNRANASQCHSGKKKSVPPLALDTSWRREKNAHFQGCPISMQTHLVVASDSLLMMLLVNCAAPMALAHGFQKVACAILSPKRERERERCLQNRMLLGVPCQSPNPTRRQSLRTFGLAAAWSAPTQARTARLGRAVPISNKAAKRQRTRANSCGTGRSRKTSPDFWFAMIFDQIEWNVDG